MADQHSSVRNLRQRLVHSGLLSSGHHSHQDTRPASAISRTVVASGIAHQDTPPFALSPLRPKKIAHGLGLYRCGRGQVPNLFASPYLRTQFPESADCTVIPNREDWVLPRQRVTDGVEITARVRHIARRRSCGLAAPGARSSRRCRLIYGL